MERPILRVSGEIQWRAADSSKWVLDCGGGDDRERKLRCWMRRGCGEDIVVSLVTGDGVRATVMFEV